MKLISHPSAKISGEVSPPSSKSHTVRALLLATFAKGKSVLNNVLDSSDAHAAIKVCRNLGAKIECIPNSSGGLNCTVEGRGMPFETDSKELFTNNSGITTTFLIPALGLRQNAEEIITLTCAEQMMKRPLGSIINAVQTLGMTVKSLRNNERCPLEISGTLEGGYTQVEGLNSQYLSALLLSLPLAPKNSIIEVQKLQERPYVDMTLTWLDEQNIRYEHLKKDNVDTFRIFGNQQYKPFTKTIPGDFSSASYLIAAAILRPGKVILHGLDMNDSQGDKRIIPILQQMGADIKIEGNEIIIEGGKELTGTTIDCGDIPDMLPTLAVIATQAKGKTTLFNVASARIKETDRIKSMAKELTKMGVKLVEKETSLIIYQSKLYRARTHGYDDHRTIMALAVAGIVADGEIQIDTAEGIKKTFPNFVEVMNSLGSRMELT